MPIPDFQSVMLPLLKIAGDGNEHTIGEATDQLAEEFQLSDDDRNELLPSQRQRRFDNRVGWASTYLRKAKLLHGDGRGRFSLTDRGREMLASKPSRIDLKLLESNFPEVVEFRHRLPAGAKEVAPSFNAADGTWQTRPAVEQRIREKVERFVRDEGVRKTVANFFAFALETVDEERDDAWYVWDSAHRLRLMAGRVLACQLSRSRLHVSVVGPVSDQVRALLSAEAEDDDDAFVMIPGAVLLRFPVEHATEAIEMLREPFSSFVEMAMARVRNAPNLDRHVPEAVAYFETVLGRALPQPVVSAEEPDDDDEDSDEETNAAREPRIRGRAQIFERGERSIHSLMDEIGRGAIALPDLQRTFVWEDTKVRDLLDSLFLGFPVGTLVLWHTADEKDARAIGPERPGLRATSLVIDGQQRLTSLYAVVRGADVIDGNGDKRKIAIAFRPRDGRFAVADAAINHDPEWLPNITDLWSGTKQNSQIRRDLINGLRDRGRPVDEKYEDAVEVNLEIAKNIVTNYRFPTIEVREAAKGTEEDVSEIFVRINNQGKRLGQADFVLTLLSVYHGALRDRIEARAREMSETGLVAIDTQQLLRAACGIAFDRARMSAVYRYLRGLDPVSGETNLQSREKMLNLLDDATQACMEDTPWRDFLLRVKHAGFVSEPLIASKNAIINSYALYIRGKRAGVAKPKLDEVISRWLFGSLLTARYSGSSETIFEEDLSRVSNQDAEGFVRALDAALGQVITGDYWTQTLVSQLETSKGRSPAALAFRAAQVVLGARALFSDQLLQNLLDPPSAGSRAAGEAHHLFPVAWLNSRGIKERKLVNQVANLADVGWHENNRIGGQNPSTYVPRIREALALDDDRWGRQCAEHALPNRWESMDYEAFLVERRRRMADVIRVAYRKLGGEAEAQPVTPPWFLPGAELVWLRIADTERGLRGIVRDVYADRFGDSAARKIEESLPDQERRSLERALRARPSGADPLTVVDYLYLGQLPSLLFSADAWPKARERLGGAANVKDKLQSALGQIAPVRNEIAHVREVQPERLQRANVACGEILEMIVPRGA